MDGAQALGAIPIDLNDINPDFYTTCGHKWLFGPEGTGVLYVNKERLHMCKSHYVGAYSDSKFDLKTQTFELKDSAARMDYGTRNVSLTVGLGEAIDLAEEIGMDRISARGKELAEYFIAKVKDKQWLEIITPISNNKFNSIVTFRLRDKDNLTIVKNLRDEKAIFIRGIYENDLNLIVHLVSVLTFQTLPVHDQVKIARFQ